MTGFQPSAHSTTTMDNDCFRNFTRAGDIRHGLPALAYTGEEFHALENQRLFPRAWVFAGFAHEMPARGDLRPVSVAGRPVLLVRGEQGGIAAFHNVCRHRCLKLVDEPGNAGRLIRCPYHSWTYGLDGRLRAAPYFGGADHQPAAGFDPHKTGLAPIPCEVWHDWIFVRLDGNPAAAFDEFIAPLAERLGHLDLTRIKPVAMLDFGAIHTNWKFLMENFIEPYHVQFVHSTTTDQPLTDHAAFIDRHCLGCVVKLPPDHIPHTPRTSSARADRLAVDSHFFTLFPNFVIATYAPNQLGVHLNTPLDAGRTHQRRAIYLLGDDDPPAGEVDALRALWRKVHAEDHAMCKRLQHGRRSPVADDGGWLSPVWETSVRRFQELVYDAVSSFQSGDSDSGGAKK